MRPELAHGIFHAAVEAIQAGRPFAAGELRSDLLEELSCQLRPVPWQWYPAYLGLADWFYQNVPDRFPCLQVLWPGRDGRIPGEDGLLQWALEDWSFQGGPPALAVISTRAVTRERAWIHLVCHDEDDGSWQFLEKLTSEPSLEQAVVVSLAYILSLDPSLHELGDLPPGGKAWREGPGLPWQRAVGRPA